MPRSYTTEERAEALAFYETDGVTRAEAKTGIHRRTIGRWAQAAGIVPQATTEKTTRARADAATRIATTWADYRARESTNAGAMAAALRTVIREQLAGTPIIADVKGKRTVVGSKIDGRNIQSLTTAFGIFIDKAELLSGNATSRIETWATSELDRDLKALVEEMEDTIRERSDT